MPKEIGRVSSSVAGERARLSDPAPRSMRLSPTLPRTADRSSFLSPLASVTATGTATGPSEASHTSQKIGSQERSADLITPPSATAGSESGTDDDAEGLVDKLHALMAEKEALRTRLGAPPSPPEDDTDDPTEASGGSEGLTPPPDVSDVDTSRLSGEAPPGEAPALRASRPAEMPARTLAEARGRCLGAANPWAPFARVGPLNHASRRRGRALRALVTGRAAMDAGGDGEIDGAVARWVAATLADGVEGGEAGEAGWRDEDAGAAGSGDAAGGRAGWVDDASPSRRGLLGFRLPPGKYKPLAPKCAAAERVKRERRADEEDLLACLGKLNRCKQADSGKVFAAAAALAGLRAVKAPAKCVIVSNAKGCTSIADNPETVPYIGTKPPPRLKADVPRTHRTCALVGNGPGLKNDGQMGKIIDSHDAVFRFNAFSSLGDWVNYTGTKSTYRVFNKKRAETMKSAGNQFVKDSSKMAKDQGEYWLYWNYMSFPYLDAVRRNNRNTAIVAPDTLRYMTNAYFKIRQDIPRLGFRGFNCPTNVNSGVHATFMALQMCERVNLFGFSYSMDMLNKRNDARSPRMSRFHDWAFDTIFLRVLHLGGFINLCTS